LVIREGDRDITHTLHGTLIPGVLRLDTDFDSGYCMSEQKYQQFVTNKSPGRTQFHDGWQSGAKIRETAGPERSSKDINCTTLGLDLDMCDKADVSHDAQKHVVLL
jgi:hypothetical protein